jgi:hypothetical protein
MGALKWIKKNVILFFTISGVFISAFILIFMLITYESPADVHCEIDFVQRPDSMFQANLYVWNTGDQTAENIVIWAKRKNVFQWDTSKNATRGPLYVFPHFSVYAQITPDRILDNLAKIKSFHEHQFIIPQLASSNREENYLIIGPHLSNLDHYKSLPTSIYRFKYMELKTIDGISSYQEDILENLQVSYKGKLLNIKVANTLWFSEVESKKMYFPTYEEFRDYKKKAVLPNSMVPPIEFESRLIKKKKDAEEDDGFFLFDN